MVSENMANEVIEFIFDYFDVRNIPESLETLFFEYSKKCLRCNIDNKDFYPVIEIMENTKLIYHVSNYIRLSEQGLIYKDIKYEIKKSCN